ncbi:G-patch domain-containing protein [Mycena sanguinolenta]|uniref:G-patch domain-containing protein n=1 Tax=Mycena sanguinolenta TaxID=230812 RepID=A0A8H7CYP8_9AGAR|nr:G-patch domain-containing protein [Mycena sanguinolenta]
MTVTPEMSDSEDDYLANIDKFLVDSKAPSAPKTYSEIRKEAAKQSKLKSEQNRIKPRRQREIESRTEGLSKSLFERAKEDEDAGLGSGNKALSIMMKMGFKPGQALGKADALNGDTQPEESLPDKEPIAGPSNADSSANPKTVGHKVEPLPINEWAGKRGIGLGVKRPRSPTSAERVAKMAKMADDVSHRNFRDRAKLEYEERRAEGRLAPAQRTCASLDEKAGKTFNVLWLNPNNPDSFPAGLLDALNIRTTLEISPPLAKQRDRDSTVSVEVRLRRQMAADSLQPLGASLDDDNVKTAVLPTSNEFSSEILEEVTQFLRLHAPDRLQLVLSYLRDNYAYCFWCGTQYESAEEMANQCPGEDEDSHD